MSNLPAERRAALLRELARVVNELELSAQTQKRISGLATSERTPTSPCDRAVLARLLQRYRQRRVDALGDRVCSDRGWHMLLELYASEEEDRPLSLGALAAVGGGPASTALRHIEQMAATGLIDRLPDYEDRRRTWVRPTSAARITLASLLNDYCATSCF